MNICRIYYFGIDNLIRQASACVYFEELKMTPEEQQQITRLNDNLKKEITIRLRESAHEANEAMAAFCEELTSLAPNIRVIREKEDRQQAPAIAVTESIAYSGVPAGTEFGPFIELLSAVGAADPVSPPEADGPLAAVATPAALTLYVSSSCPHCPAMVRQVYPLSIANSNLKLTIIDGPAFPEIAEADQIKSLPTLILDDNFRWIAAVDTEELLQVMGSRDPAELGPAALKGMLRTAMPMACRR